MVLEQCLQEGFKALYQTRFVVVSCSYLDWLPHLDTSHRFSTFVFLVRGGKTLVSQHLHDICKLFALLAQKGFGGWFCPPLMKTFTSGGGTVSL